MNHRPMESAAKLRVVNCGGGRTGSDSERIPQPCCFKKEREHHCHPTARAPIMKRAVLPRFQEFVNARWAVANRASAFEEISLDASGVRSRD
jgi:hypothetical protein